MSESKTKRERKLKLMTEEAGIEETAREMARQISKMYEDRDKKATGAREHLVSQLRVTSDKYRTANGVMSALDTIRTVLGETRTKDVCEGIQMAQRLAKDMAVVAQNMADKAEALGPDDMDQLCDGFYDTDVTGRKLGPEDLAKQLMMLQLCQNVGPNAQDVADFITTADTEIEKAREDLRRHCEEYGLDFDELCGPHDDRPDCLCMSCANSCKEGRTIGDGMSAYDVCEKFVEEEK